VTRNPLLRTEAGRRCAAVAADLAIPVPFALGAFRDRLERVTDRETHLQAVPLPAGAGSGIRLSSDGADYLYFEERTSPFHQACIVTGLAARMLLSGPGPVIDAKFTHGLGPQLIRHIFGDEIRTDGDRGDAELCAYLALEGMRPTVSRLAAHRFLADLAPLPRALAPEVAGAAAGLGKGGRGPAGFRLYQAVTGILDLMLASGLPPGTGAVSRTLAQEAARLARLPAELAQLAVRLDPPPGDAGD
jgi:hypothetical protein